MPIIYESITVSENVRLYITELFIIVGDSATITEELFCVSLEARNFWAAEYILTDEYVRIVIPKLPIAVNESVLVADYFTRTGFLGIKTYCGLAAASVATVNGLAIASVKSKNGLLK